MRKYRIVCRKEHACKKCGGPIVKGEVCWTYDNNWPGPYGQELIPRSYKHIDTRCRETKYLISGETIGVCESLWEN